MALRDVYGFHRWDFLQFASRVELQAAYTIGNVSVSAGGTSWTGAGGASWDTGWTGGIKIRAGDEVYRVTSIGSTTGLTSTDAALGALSSVSYVLYIDVVSLDSTLETIEAAIVTLGGKRLVPITPAAMRDMKARGCLVGRPNYFAPAGRDSNGYTQIELYPIPSQNEVLHVQGYKAGTVPTATGSTDDVPDRWDNVVDERAKFYMFRDYEKNLTLAQLYQQSSFALMLKMKGDEGMDGGPMTIKLDPVIHGPYRVTSDVNTVVE